MKKLAFLYYLLWIPTHIETHLCPDFLVGSFESLYPQFRYLSLVRGAHLTESKKLLALYDAHPAHPATDLVKKLFYKNWYQLAPTVAYNNPASYLNQKEIAFIIVYLHSRNQDLLDMIYEMIHLNASQSLFYEKSSFNRHLNVLIREMRNVHDSMHGDDEHLIFDILLSFLYQKATYKHEVVCFYEHLDAYLNCLSDPGLLQKQAPRTEEELQLIEKNVIAYYTEQRPHQLAQNYIDYENEKGIPDCMETVLREFCNLIMYDPIQKRFSSDRMKHLNLINIEFFYRRIETAPHAVQSYFQAHTWYKIVSRIPSCAYVLDGYEMIPSKQNFLHALNFLFCINAQSIQELVLLLSGPQIIIGWGERTTQTPDGDVTVLDFAFNDKTASQITHMSVYLNPQEGVRHGWVHMHQRDN